MEGIKYLIDDQKKTVAVQIDLDKYGDLWEDFYDVIVAKSREEEESIPFEDLVNELKSSGKLDKDV